MTDKWQSIETAPKDGTEILAYREDAGIFLALFTCCNDFMTEKEMENMDEETCFKMDWFYADFLQGGRLEKGEEPTHWMPLPPAPKKINNN